MICTDIETLKLQLIRICNEFGSVILDKSSSKILINYLQDIEDRTAELETNAVFKTNPLKNNDLTNVVFFPTTQNKGDVA